MRIFMILTQYTIGAAVTIVLLEMGLRYFSPELGPSAMLVGRLAGVLLVVLAYLVRITLLARSERSFRE